MKSAGTWQLLGIASIMILLSGCVVGPDYHQAKLANALQDHWNASRQPGAEQYLRASPPTLAWWDQFHDAQLSAMVKELITSNLPLAQARERLIGARARRGIVHAKQLPQVNLESDYTHAETGEKALTFQGPPPGRSANIYRIGAAAGWEIDLWGRVKRLLEAEDRDIEAEHEALNELAVSLVSELTLAYVDARTLEYRIELLNKTIDLDKDLFALSQAREEAGNGTRIARIQLQKQLQKTRALKPELNRQLTIALNRIDILRGKAPQGESLPSGRVPTVPSLLGIGVPADLITRRADIREAERRYAAAVARIGAAKAEKYPSISLSGAFSLQSDDAGALFDPKTFVYSLGPGLHFPLFSGGRIDSQVSARQSRAEQARLALQQQLILAVKEVEDATAGVVRSQMRLQALQAVLDSARENQQMTQQLYAAGLDSRAQWLKAAREVVSSEDELALSRQQALQQTVLLYRALGGGWAAMDMNKVAESIPKNIAP